MSLWSKLWRRKNIKTAQELADFLAIEADVLTQRSILHYTQALLGQQWKKLIATEEFRIAMYRSRWESYPAILGDLVCVAEALLRNAAPLEISERSAAFERLYSAALAARPVPREFAGDAQPAIDRFASELGRRLMADPKPSDRLAVSGGVYLFDHLPIHESARETHKLPVVNAVRFAVVGIRDRLERKIVDPADLLGRLRIDSAGGGGSAPRSSAG
jgi:hypothetical protein